MDVMAEGFSVTMDATSDTQEICTKLKNDVERRTVKTYASFKALKYRQNGTIFLIKVHVGGQDHLHLKVFQTADKQTTNLFNLQEGHGKDDPIIPF
ncbi:leukocyte cysteine proteinase inhibitor 1-like [Symphorus nematophorus]